MPENTQRKLWFRAKRYGWGWQPSSWQGWLALALYAAVLVCLFFRLDAYTSVTVHRVIIDFVLPMACVSGLLVILCYGTGEKPTWRWGGEDEEDGDSSKEA